MPRPKKQIVTTSEPVMVPPDDLHGVTVVGMAPLVIPDSEIPDFSVVERRIKYGDAHVMSGAVSIELRDQPEPMTLRWGNMQFEGRNNYLRKYKGWQPVRTAELAGQLDAGILGTSPEGYVTRGEKGQEVLYKMPTRLYRLVETRKVEDNLKRSRSAKHLKEQTQSSMVRDADTGNLPTPARERLLRGSDQLGKLDVDLTETTERVELEG